MRIEKNALLIRRNSFSNYKKSISHWKTSFYSLDLLRPRLSSFKGRETKFEYGYLFLSQVEAIFFFKGSTFCGEFINNYNVSLEFWSENFEKKISFYFSCQIFFSEKLTRLKFLFQEFWPKSHWNSSLKSRWPQLLPESGLTWKTL